jgi:hypothetical protein
LLVASSNALTLWELILRIDLIALSLGRGKISIDLTPKVIRVRSKDERTYLTK